jgi:hypothetical protein
MTIASQLISQIFTQFSPHVFLEFIVGYKAVLFLMLVGFILHFIPKSLELKTEQLVIKMPLTAKAALFVAIIVLVIQTKSAGIQPFIYFQF